MRSISGPVPLTSWSRRLPDLRHEPGREYGFGGRAAVVDLARGAQDLVGGPVEDQDGAVTVVVDRMRDTDPVPAGRVRRVVDVLHARNGCRDAVERGLQR